MSVNSCQFDINNVVRTFKQFIESMINLRDNGLAVGDKVIVTGGRYHVGDSGVIQQFDYQGDVVYVVFPAQNGKPKDVEVISAIDLKKIG